MGSPYRHRTPVGVRIGHASTASASPPTARTPTPAPRRHPLVSRKRRDRPDCQPPNADHEDQPEALAHRNRSPLGVKVAAADNRQHQPRSPWCLGQDRQGLVVIGWPNAKSVLTRREPSQLSDVSYGTRFRRRTLSVASLRRFGAWVAEGSNLDQQGCFCRGDKI